MSAQLDQTRLTQPALFVMEYALAQMWISLGVKPTALLGHSLGQYVAACLAGVLSLDDALGLVAERGRLMQALPPGAMLAVGLPEAEIMPLLNPELSLAAVNGPALCVAAGSSTAITELQSTLEPRGVATHRLRTSHAFHSHMMDPVLEPFRAHVARARLRPPTLPIVSNVNGSWLGAEASTAEYWVEHLRQPVRFSEGLATLLTSQPHVLLEVGYGRTLANLARQHSAADVRSLRGVIPGLTTHDASGGVISLLETVGRLWLAGASINWPALHPRPPRRVPLPRYPFERRRYWAEPRLSLNDSSTFAPRAWEQPEGIEEASQALTAKAHVGPRNETECAVAAVWAELLGIDRIDVRDDFLELGGTSLLAVQVAARLRQVFNVELPLRYFLEAPTVEAVSSRIEQERLESSDPEIVARLVGEIAQLSGAEVSQVLTAQVAAEPVAKRA
jgi:phthiocerol/phenolphthiocerol synthesis type-I polyketide synthase E